MTRISKIGRLLPAVILCFGAARAQSQVLVAGSVPLEISEDAAAANSGGAAALREGMPVVLAFTGSLSSKTAVKGDLVSLVLVNDINAGGVTVAKAGCKAVGRVTYARAAAIPGRSGALNLQFDYLEVGDKKVKLRASKERSGEYEVQYSHPYRLKWPMGLLRTGDEVEIKQGTVLAVYVAEDISL